MMRSHFLVIYFTSLLLFQLSSFTSKAQHSDDRIDILCEPVEVNIKKLPDNKWNIIINDEKQYRKIVGKKSDIDFSRYTLIGATYSSGGCSAPTVTHSIYLLAKTNAYRFELNIQENGLCKPIFQGCIWCTVPKIESNKQINFIKRVSTKP